MSPNEYAKLPRNSKRENEVCNWLRGQSEDVTKELKGPGSSLFLSQQLFEPELPWPL